MNIGFNCEVFSASHVRDRRPHAARGLLLRRSAAITNTRSGRPVLEQARSSKGVAIGAGAWLGAGVKVLDGAAIGDGAIVGAGAVVRGEIPAGAIAVGMPARVVGTP